MNMLLRFVAWARRTDLGQHEPNYPQVRPSEVLDMHVRGEVLKGSLVDDESTEGPTQRLPLISEPTCPPPLGSLSQRRNVTCPLASPAMPSTTFESIPIRSYCATKGMPFSKAAITQASTGDASAPRTA